MSHIHVIMNANSGTGSDEAAAQRIVAAFGAAGAQAIVERVEGAALRDTTRAAIARRPRMIVAAGGDGTVSAVASQLVDGDVPLGVLPLGTLNHFARALGIPLDLEAAARALVDGRDERVDVGEVQGRTFVNNSSIGLYPDFVRRREAREKRGWGRYAASASAIGSTFRRYRHLRVKVDADGDGHACKTPFVCIGNNAYSWEGGSAGERSRLDAGRLAVYCGHRLSRFGWIGLVVRAFLGRLRPDADFYARNAREVRVETRPEQVAVALDGEIIAMTSPLGYRIRPQALPVVVPQA